MARIAVPPSVDLPSHVWCVTNEKKHLRVRDPPAGMLLERRSFILSFARKYHADVFGMAVSYRKDLRKEWPAILMEKDYRVVMPGPADRATTTNNLEIDEIKLVDLLQKCTLNGVSIGLVHDYRTMDANIELKGTKLDPDKVLTVEHYRARLDKILKTS